MSVIYLRFGFVFVIFGFNLFWVYVFALQIFMDQFGVVPQQKSYHPLFPFIQQKWAKEKETLPLFILCLFHFCNSVYTSSA